MARPPLRRANVIEETRFRLDCLDHAGARHWSEHCDFQRRQRGAAAAASIRRAGASGRALGEQTGGTQLNLVPELFRLARAEPVVRADGVVLHERHGAHGHCPPVNLRSAVVSPDLFATLGVKPQLGRWFVAEEEKPGIRAAIINHGLWRRQFGGEPNVIGRALTLNGKQFNVIGVMPAGFQFPIEAEPVEVWVTSSIDGEKTDPKEPAMNEQRCDRAVAGRSGAPGLLGSRAAGDESRSDGRAEV